MSFNILSRDVWNPQFYCTLVEFGYMFLLHYFSASSKVQMWGFYIVIPPTYEY